MEREDIKKNKEEEEQAKAQEAQASEEQQTEDANEEQTQSEDDLLIKSQQELGEMKDKYLRLYSDFENYRRRTAKEKLDFMKTANEDLIVSLLSVIDDFERAGKHLDNDIENDELKAFSEGMELIFNKLLKLLEGKGMKPMEDPVGKEFDMDYHEAITQIPAPTEDMKGKVIDVIEKGYLLDEKVIRYAKVVVGS